MGSYDEDKAAYSIKAGVVLVGEQLEVMEDKCIWVRDGIIESIESLGSCNDKSIGGRHVVALPQPANAHIHSADYAFPEYGIDLDLESLVSYPKGMKHVMLEKLDASALENAILASYRSAWMHGLGLIADFREGGGDGCRVAKRALASAPSGIDVVVLGRPGPGWPSGCDGLGVSSPLDYGSAELSSITRGWDIKMAHIAESRDTRIAGDLEVALEYGFTGLIHGVYLDRRDLESIAASSVSLVLCLRSNMWHGIGIPPVRDILELGIVFSLGTDNMAWMTPDVWEEARALLYVARLNGVKSPEVMDYALQALFINGYRALNRKPKVIREGGSASLLLLADYDEAVLRALNRKAAIIKRSGKGNLIARIDEGEVAFL